MRSVRLHWITTKIKTVCEKLHVLCDNRDRDRAVCDLTGLVKRSLEPSVGHPPEPRAFQPHPIFRPELIDDNGNLRAADIGITWTGSETFLHGVKNVGPVRDHVGCNLSTMNLFDQSVIHVLHIPFLLDSICI